jgi:hypothetical protein
MNAPSDACAAEAVKNDDRTKAQIPTERPENRATDRRPAEKPTAEYFMPVPQSMFARAHPANQGVEVFRL